MDFHRISNYFGAIANTQFITPLQKAINGWYINHFNIDLSEFAPLESYKSLNELFTRKLIAARTLDDGFISPSDGVCLYSGDGDGALAYSIKGHSYNALELLDRSADIGELDGGFSYFNIYLSPKDYHHYHAPTDLQILSAQYIPGELNSVAPKWLAKIANLYSKNERVIIKARLKNSKIIWLVYVGALNVGKMGFDFEPRIKTNAQNGGALYDYKNAPINIQKGEHMGNFELGSTIVIIAQNGAIKYIANSGDTLKFAQKIGDLN